MSTRSNLSIMTGIVRNVPLLFHRLRAVGDALHAELGVTTPMRGVMQSLFIDGPQTVPQLAAARPVSRQHIQMQVDALAERGFVRTAPNPAHKRSSHIVLTDAGRQLFETMQKKEAEVLAGIAGPFSHAELKTTEQTLAKLAEEFALLAENLEEIDHGD